MTFLSCGKSYFFVLVWLKQKNRQNYFIVRWNVKKYNTRLNQTLFSWVAEFYECGVFFVRYAVVTLTFVTSHSCLSFFMFRFVHWTAFNGSDIKIIAVVIRTLKCRTMHFKNMCLIKFNVIIMESDGYHYLLSTFTLVSIADTSNSR